MNEIILRDLPDQLHSELQRRAQQNGHTVEEEAFDIMERFLTRERYARIAEEQGLGAALQQIGQDFDITDEFDNLRERQSPDYPTSK